MIDYAKLELRKHRLLFYGMALSFLVSLPLVYASLLLSNPAPQSVGQGINAWLLFWTLVGLPGMAVLFGASSGAGLRAAPTREAEEPLPISPRRKATASVLADALHLLFLSLMVLLAAFILSPDWRDTLLTPHSPPALFAQIFFGLMAFTMVYLLLLSFTLAYAFGHGILGGGLALAVGGVAAAALTAGWGLRGIFGFRAPFLTAGSLAITAGLAGAAWALSAAAPWIERKARGHWWKAALIALGLAAGALASAAALSITFHRLTRALIMISPEDRFYPWLSARGDLALLPEARRTASSGALLSSLAGDLLWITPEGGRTTLLRGDEPALMDLLKNPWWREIDSVAWDADGSLWALISNWGDKEAGIPSTYELWTGKPPGPLSLRLKMTRGGPEPRPYDLARRGQQLGMLAFGPEADSTYFAPLPEKGRMPQWSRIGKTRTRFLLDSWKASGLVALVSRDHRSLTWKSPEGKVERWRLPGEAYVLGDVVRPLAMGAERVFAVTVNLGKDRSATAFCYPGGRVKTAWERPAKAWFWPASNPDGAHWGWRGDGKLHIITPKGEILPPLRMENVAKATLGGREPSKPWWGQVVHVTEEKAWFVVDRRFLVALDNRTGEVLEKWRLPAVARGKRRWDDATIHVTPEGMFFHTGRRLHFIDWNGNRRDLGSV